MAMTSTQPKAMPKPKQNFDTKPNDFNYTGDDTGNRVSGALNAKGMYEITFHAKTFSKRELKEVGEILHELAEFQ